MSDHVHMDGETLLELVLNGEPRPTGVASCAVCCAELAEFEHVVLRARRALDARELVAGDDARRVAESVLARTTRENLGLDGDLALVTSFVQRRLAASPWLRLLAASLLIHLLALPVLAWFGLTQQRAESVPTFRFAPPEEHSAWPDERALELPELSALSPLDETLLEGDARDGDARADTLRIARFFASAGAPELPPERPDEGEVEQLLRLRAETIGAYAKRTRTAKAAPDPEPHTPLGRVLFAELLLDRATLGAGPAPDELARALEGVDPERADPSARLAAATLARAESHGLLRDERHLEAVRSLLEPELGELLRRPVDGVRRVDPFDRRWIALLEQALEPGLESAPVVAAWLAYGR